MTGHQAQEFTCCECRREIVRIIPDNTGHVCAMCLHLPGWFREPELRRILDPDHDGSDPADVVRETPDA